MDKNAIKIQEAANDGQSVFLYYDAMAGVYLAYGLSAYYTTMATEPYISYSEEMQMPVVLLNRLQIKFLRQSLTKVEHQPQACYRFRLRSKVGTAGYERWMKETFGDSVGISKA